MRKAATAATKPESMAMGNRARVCRAVWRAVSRDGSLIPVAGAAAARRPRALQDRKSTRLNSSHSQISYAVFCLKKKKKQQKTSIKNYQRNNHAIILITHII